MYFFRQKNLPNKEISPQTAHITKAIPTEPASWSAEAGDMKIPDPIITPKIMLMAENNPNSLLSCIPSFFLASSFSMARFSLTLKQIINVFNKQTNVAQDIRFLCLRNDKK